MCVCVTLLPPVCVSVNGLGIRVERHPLVVVSLMYGVAAFTDTDKDALLVGKGCAVTGKEPLLEIPHLSVAWAPRSSDHTTIYSSSHFYIYTFPFAVGVACQYFEADVT